MQHTPPQDALEGSEEQPALRLEASRSDGLAVQRSDDADARVAAAQTVGTALARVALRQADEVTESLAKGRAEVRGTQDLARIEAAEVLHAGAMRHVMLSTTRLLDFGALWLQAARSDA